MKFLKALTNGGHRGADSPSQADHGEHKTMVDRYAGLGEREAVAELGQLNQVELTAVESYERSHRDRAAVVNKLRYLRQPEPLPGYDALDGTEVAEALAGADMPTVKAVREYERKMQNRTTVLQEVARAQHRLTDAAGPPAIPDADPPSVLGNGLPSLPPPRAAGQSS